MSTLWDVVSVEFRRLLRREMFMGSGAAQMGAVMDQEHVIAHARQGIIIIFFIIRAAVVVVGLDLGDDDDDDDGLLSTIKFCLVAIW